MRVHLSLEEPNILSVEQTHSVMRYVNALKQRVAEAEAENAALRQDLLAADNRTTEAEGWPPGCGTRFGRRLPSLPNSACLTPPRSAPAARAWPPASR